MKTKYIVLNKYSALVIGRYEDTPTKGVLVNGGDEVTVFSNRRTAQRAIIRTNKYAEKYKLPWDKQHHIKRLVNY